LSISVANAVTGGNESSTAVGTSGAPLQATAFNLAAGHDVLVFVKWFAGTIDGGITDTAGNTYSPVPGASASGVNNVAAYLCSGSTANASNVVQVNSTAGITFASVHVLDIAGVATSSAVDVAAGSTQAYNTSTTTVTTAAFSTAQASEIVVAICGLNGGSQVDAGTPTIGGTNATWATRITASGFGVNNTGTCYVIESATQSGIDAVFTINEPSGSGTADMAVVSLKAPGGGSTFTGFIPKRMPLGA
jgi:hypothetical protein